MNVREYDQHQTLLFPPHLKDFLSDDHPAMIINDIIETLDLSCLYRKVPSEGNPSYHPKMMLKILVYAYANGMFSSRKIQAAVQESVAFIFLAAWQQPDFRTISDFRKNNLDDFRALFNQVVTMCKRLGMVSLGHVAIDGSKFKANASDKKTYDKKRINDAIDKLLEQADQIDRQEDCIFGPENDDNQVPEQVRRQKDRLEKLQQIKKELEQSGNKKINATDPDAVFMKTKHGIKTSYNGQVAVEKSHNIIVAADVTQDPSDTEQLVPMVEQTKEQIGSPDKVSADSGYSSGPNLQKLAEQGIDAHIPDANYQGRQRGKQEAPGEALFTRSCFKRDELKDCFICPAGEKLTFYGLQKVKNKEPLRLYRCAAFKKCALKSKCTKSRSGRTITLNAYDDQFRAMRNKLDSPLGKKIYAQRKSIVEPVFGQLKENMGFQKFLLRGLEKVTGEFLLACMAYNMRKIVNALKLQRPISCQVSPA